jgi:hypothetical protein
MSSMASWEDLAALASRLQPSDQLRLVERIVHGLAAPDEALTMDERRSWREIRGRAAYPLCGEDAQTWISRGRSESDEARDAPIRVTPCK